VAQVRQTVADALQWVKGELDQSVLRVRQAIEAYLENTQDPLPLQRAVVELHQVRGTLAMVRCHGAALLADEMKQGLQDVMQSPATAPEPLFEGLLGATLQLTDYLDLLGSGVIDNSLVFQPQINELRVARGKPVLSETALFVQHMGFEGVQPVLPDLRHRPAGQAQIAARKFLPVYQTSLLQWIKDQEVELNLRRLGKIAEQVTVSTRHADVYQLWWLFSATIEALLSKGLQAGLEVKRLIGQAGQQLKALAEHGEDDGLVVPAELSYSLLYMVGRSTHGGPRAKAVGATYDLEELLPPLAQLEDIRARLRGPNTQLLQRLSDALKEDITAVKDAIDLLVRAGDKAPIQLDETIVTVDRISDTLGMLGLEMLQRVVMNQSKLIEQLKERGSHEEKAWMDVAIALLRVETSLDDALHRQVRRPPATDQGAVAGPADEPAESDISAADLQGGESAVWREALVNIARIKVQVRDYMDDGERTLVAEIARQLNEIAAGFEIQGQNRGAEQARLVKAFVLSPAMDRLRDDSKLSNQLADAIVNLEYYLEALQSRQPHADALVDNVAACVELLKGPTAESHRAATPRPQATVPKPIVSEAATTQEVDPEIREVFLDEANEVLAQMQSDLGRWQQNIEDMEVVRDLRRAFHTLKGSGRMVGAQLIGEFGWSHENLLNKCLDGSLTVSNAVLGAISEAVAVLPALILDFSEGTTTSTVRAQRLIESAAVAARGQVAAGADAELLQIFRQDAKQRLGEVEQFLKEAKNTLPVDPVVIRAFHTLRGSSESVSAPKLAKLAGALEHYTESVRTAARTIGPEEKQLLADATRAMQDFIDAMTNPAVKEPDLASLMARIESLQAAIPAEAADAASDYELVIIFTDEACDILDQAQDSLRAWANAPLDVHHSRALKRLFHTLKGSARTAQAPAIGEVAELIEGQVAHLGDNGNPPPPDFLKRIEQAVEGLYDLIDRFRNGERTLPVAPLVAALQLGATTPIVTATPVAAAPLHSAPPDDTHAVPASDVPVEQAASALDMPAVEEPALEMPAVAEPEESLHFDMPPVPEEASAAEDNVLEMPQPPADLRAQPVASPALSALQDGETPDQDLVDIFTDEAQELIEEIEQQLARWELDPRGVQAPRELLRSLHTLKGSARMAHVAGMGDLSHELESLIGAVEIGNRAADAPFFAKLRNAVDTLYDMQEKVQRGDLQVSAGILLEDLRADTQSPATPPTTPAPRTAPGPEYKPAPVVLAPPMPESASQPGLSNDGVGSRPAKPAETPADLPVVEAVPLPIHTGPWAPSLFVGPAGAEGRSAQAEMARISVEQLDSMLNEAGEISIYRSRLEQQNTSLQFQLSEMLQTISRIRDQVRNLDSEAQSMILARQQGQAEASPDRYEEEFDPLEMDRYSRLQETSRSLAESMTDLESVRDVLDELRGQNEMLLLQQARVNSELQQKLMRSLMVPFARQAQRLERIVRQTGQEYGKKVRIDLSGTEAELDRNVLERMVPPLEHLLRNAIVHGIEPPTERVGVGKPEAGTVSVRLSRDGPQLVIDISDDGRGLNLPAIRRKAVEMGLIPEGTKLGEADTIAFIFEPGFSTASEITQVAGRGVGMDVVNAEIKQLGGSIEVSTEAGKGTHFIVRLPLSLAITQALLIHVAEEMYALPMNTIEGIARVARTDLPGYLDENGRNLEYGGQSYRVRQMAELLHLHEMNLQEGEKTVSLLLVRAGDRRVALAIDEVLGTSEVVVKSVGLQVSSVIGVTGATILADGRVVVILDMPALAQAHMRRVLTAEVRHAPVAEAEEERPLVMVVDDSITMRRVAERTLLRNGFRVSTAKDGMDALGKLQTEFPAVVLLDIEMPRIDGFELATYMRNSEKLKGVPIIMITSRSGEKHRARAEQIGVERYMIKPYQEDQLIQSIHELLPRKH
jgi:chemosensory pili system protein ChpA (sensor histidine kinase/response regulator)